MRRCKMIGRMELGRETEMDGGPTIGIKEHEEDDLGNKGINMINDGDFDVCPICLDIFTIPCRSNCGHLFCAACILQFWMYRYSIQPCKCPLCCSRILNLEPQISGADDGVEVLKKVQQYNGLYISGLFGLLHKMSKLLALIAPTLVVSALHPLQAPFVIKIVQALPLLTRRIFKVLVDPDCLRCIYYVMRVFGLFLGLLYERVEFEFIRAGGFGIQRMFDLTASLIVATLFLVGVVYRWMLKRRARHLTTI